MDNNSRDQSKKKTIYWLKAIGFPIVIILVMIIGMDIVRMPKEEALKTTTLTTLQNKTIHFTSTSKPTVLYFWGSWCVFCRHTSPTIEKLYQEGYSVVSIAMKSGTNAEIETYLQKHQLQFPVVNDQDGKISQAFSVAVVPTIAIVNDGKISITTSGWTSEYGLKLRLWLVKLLRHNV